jgi:sugar lactone lactonase YvrE
MSLGRALSADRRVTLAWAAQAIHAETPRWDARRGELDFIDVARGEWLSFEPRAGAGRRRRLAQELGFLQPSADPHRPVVAVDVRLGTPGSADPAAAFVPLGPEAPGDAARVRLNDAGVDHEGRLWTGTMCRRGRDPVGRIFRLRDGEFEPIDEGYVIPNGFAFSRDGRTVYVADSPRRVIHAYALREDGLPAARRVLFGPTTADDGFPDGMAVDVEEHVWVAFYDGGCVRRLRPDGSVERTVRLPAGRVTACAFGGPDLATLYVTADGSLYAYAADVAGLPVVPARLP